VISLYTYLTKLTKCNTENKLLPDSPVFFYYYLLCNGILILLFRYVFAISLVPRRFCHTRGGPGYSAVSRVDRATHESCGLAGGPGDSRVARASRESEFLAGGPEQGDFGRI